MKGTKIQIPKEIENYKPSETPNPEDIPKGYRPCEHLGKEGLIDFWGRGIVCKLKECPYRNMSTNWISWELEDKLHICNFKGLVKITKEGE